MPTARHAPPLAPPLSSLQRRRLALFDQGARALAAYQRRSVSPADDVTGPGPAVAVYRCPLCEQDLEREAALDGRLTLEHVPARALGGRGVVLTCKPCNNRAGEFVDENVRRRDELRRVEAAVLAHVGTWSGRATLDAGDYDVVVDVAIFDEPAPGGAAAAGATHRIYQIVPVARSNDPTALARFAADTRRSDYRITPWVGFYPARARLGDLRAAYLAAFAAFGYTYALSPCLDSIRKRLRLIRDPAAVRALMAEGTADGPELYVQGSAPRRQGEPTFRLGHLRAPFAAVLVDLGTGCVVLPALDGPESPRAAMAAVRHAPPTADVSPRAGQRAFSLEGTWREWPETLTAQMDYGEASR